MFFLAASQLRVIKPLESSNLLQAWNARLQEDLEYWVQVEPLFGIPVLQHYPYILLKTEETGEDDSMIVKQYHLGQDQILKVCLNGDKCSHTLFRHKLSGLTEIHLWQQQTKSIYYQRFNWTQAYKPKEACFCGMRPEKDHSKDLAHILAGGVVRMDSLWLHIHLVVI